MLPRQRAFISYSRKNTDFALRLARDLRAQGADIWLDQLDIPVGKRWDVAIQEALEMCSHLIFVMSEDAFASQNVMDEVNYGLDEKMHILPVLIQPCKIPFRLRRYQYIDFTQITYQAGLNHLLTILPAAGETISSGDTQSVEPVVLETANDSSEIEPRSSLDLPPSTPRNKLDPLSILQSPDSKWFALVAAAKDVAANQRTEALPALQELIEHEILEVRLAVTTAIEQLSTAKPSETISVDEPLTDLPEWLKEESPNPSTPDDIPEWLKAETDTPAKKSEQKKVGIQTVKLLVSGPYRAGKTGFINSLSEIKVVTNSEPTAAAAHQTVAMDFGRITVDEGLVIYLFGTPSHARFDFMWEILAEGMLGLVLLVDVTRPETFFEARKIAEIFIGYAPVPLVIALNHYMLPGAFSLNDMKYVFSDFYRSNMVSKIVQCDVNQASNNKKILLEMLYTILDEMNNAQAASTHGVLLNPYESPTDWWDVPINPSFDGFKKSISKDIRIQRALLADAEIIGAFLNRLNDTKLTLNDVRQDFKTYAYWTAWEGDRLVGVAKAFIENLVTRLHFYVPTPYLSAVLPILEADIHTAVGELMCELMLVEVTAGQSEFLGELGYQEFTDAEKSLEIRNVNLWMDIVKTLDVQHIMYKILHKRVVTPI